MRCARRRRRLVLLAPLLSSSAAAAEASSCGRRGVSSLCSTGGGAQRLRVTPFFAALFPAQFAAVGSTAEANLSGSVRLQRALRRRDATAGDDQGAATSKWDFAAAAAPNPSAAALRSWHLIANLKHTALHTENNEKDVGTEEGGKQKNLAMNRYNDEASDDVTFTLQGGDTGVEDNASRRRRKRHVTPSEVFRLVRNSIRAVQRCEQASASMTAATAAGATPLSDALEAGDPHDEAALLQNNVLTVSTERLLTYVLDGGEVTGGAAKTTLEPLRLALSKTQQASTYGFHLIFESLVRQGEDRLAVELFRRWWRHNPQLFPIELELHREEDAASMLRAIRAENDNASADAIAAQQSVIAQRLAQVPYKKYLVSSALFTRVLTVALQLGDPEVTDQFVLQEMLYQGVYTTVCGGCSGSDEDDAVSHSSNAELRFHLFRENYEDWLVLIGAIAASAVLQRHVEAFVRHQRGGAGYDRLVQTLREEYMAFICKACCPQMLHSFGAGCKAMKDVQPTGTALEAPGWAKLLFMKVLRCYEESGVFHASHVRRPGNTAALWRQIHTQLIRQFPHVFHAGNTVTTLLSFAALEEAAVSSLGTHRMSFCGKEEALCRWRLECLSSQKEICGNNSKNGTEVDFEAVSLDALGDLPRVSRRLQARFVAAHSSLSGRTKNDPIDSKSEAPEGGGGQQQLHRKQRELFGSALSVSASRLSIPVFVTAQQVRSYAADALDEIEAARRSALDIFCDHTSLPILRPASPLDVVDPGRRRNHEDIVAEASQPSIFLFMRLVSLLASIGERTTATVKVGEAVEEGDMGHHFPLVECLEKDIVPFCHPSVASYLRRCCITSLSRSGVRGMQALVSEHQELLQQMREAAAVERLLVGLLWGGDDVNNNGGALSPSTRFSFGSGSLAWQVVMQHRRIVVQSGGGSLLEMVLSHLATLALAIPDDQRRVVFVSPHMYRLGAGALDAEGGALSALRDELRWNPPSALHLYVSLLELLARVAEVEDAAGEHRVEDDGSGGESNISGEEDDDGVGREVPSLAMTARHWCVVQRCLRTCAPPFVSLPPSFLERVCFVLVHTCPDVELMLVCLLSLLQHPPPGGSLGNVNDGVVGARPGPTVSFVTPRLLTGLCGLLVMNGVKKSNVQEWRQQNGAPCGCDANRSALHNWHLVCYERMMPVTVVKSDQCDTDGVRCSAMSADCDEDSGTGDSDSWTCAGAHLLGSVVLDVLLTDARWHSLHTDNYYVAVFTSTGVEAAAEEDVVVANAARKKTGPFSLGVVLPSRQMASAYPAGVRHRVTNLRDALREMGPEGRLQMRKSFSPIVRRTGEKMVLETCWPTDAASDDDDDDDSTVRLFSVRNKEEGGATV
ncbi:hypothetical protein DQ04_01991050 [Trypanosoma grayi]|uniref:hypothetical protein n=1 Tax=Trypanosoma grayi TaxID=71804 RepID=UPI0004F457DE|nr:hypothetical protein DQ04_01991050 [Trypanosoma grayi]KEG12116.1 hypothetical protein DQ04_01991050 [Trypanosoma grayi]